MVCGKCRLSIIIFYQSYHDLMSHEHIHTNLNIYFNKPCTNLLLRAHLMLLLSSNSILLWIQKDVLFCILHHFPPSLFISMIKIRFIKEDSSESINYYVTYKLLQHDSDSILPSRCIL